MTCLEETMFAKPWYETRLPVAVQIAIGLPLGWLLGTLIRHAF
jgi:hypothetical protein